MISPELAASACAAARPIPTSSISTLLNGSRDSRLSVSELSKPISPTVPGNVDRAPFKLQAGAMADLVPPTDDRVDRLAAVQQPSGGVPPPRLVPRAVHRRPADQGKPGGG